MHNHTARTFALLLALLVIATFFYVSTSYLDTRDQVIAERRARELALVQKPAVDKRQDVERKYVPPAPITHPFY